jgi:hypothetical protein
MLRSLLRRLPRPKVREVSHFAARYNRAARYGLDLVLWSRLIASRRDPIPLELPERLLQTKDIAFAPPTLHVSGPPERVGFWDDGFAAVNAALFLNLNTPDILTGTRYAHPAPAFQGVYLWDSAFIAQVWKPWDPAVAREVNEAVVDLRDGDRLQHVVADVAASAYTQPPLVAWSVWRLCEARVHDPAVRAYLRRVYVPLARYNDWLYRNRRVRGDALDGLFFWEHPYESGVENAPRFSNRDESHLADTTVLAAPDLSAYVVLQNEALAAMGRAIGDAGADRFARQADRLRERMDLLWHDADGLYYDRHTLTGDWIRSKTIASLLPLWAGVPDEPKAWRLLEHIVDPAAFNTRVPLPSVARDDPDFSKDMWRGPVWINTAYGVLLGMERYGFLEEAADLAYRLCEGVYRTHAHERRLFEYYDPERFDIDELSRKEGNTWKQVTLGGKPRPEFVGWSGLVNTLLIEHLAGIRERATQEGAQVVVEPRFPPQAEGLAFALRLPALGCAVTIDVLPGGDARVAVRREGLPTLRRDVPRGETLMLDLPETVGS